MPWHIKQKCLPAIPPIGFTGACDDCGPQLDNAPRRVNRDTAWRGYIEARERFQEAYDHLHNLRQAYGPEFRCNDDSCRLCFGRGSRSAPVISDVKGVCQYCRGVGSSPYCYCGNSYNPMTGFGRSYGYDDPALWDPNWCNCSGSNSHRQLLSADQYLSDRHVATTRTVRTKRTTTTYMQPPPQQPQTQIIHIQAPVQQAPPPPPMQMVAQPPMQMVAQQPMQMVAQQPVPVVAPQPQPQPQLMYTDPEAYPHPRRPMVAVGFSFPHGEMSQRETWCRSSERLEQARSAYVSNLTHLKRLGLTKFNSSCCYGGYSYPSKSLSYRW